MAVIKPTVSKVRPPDDTRMKNGNIYNPPRFLKFTGLDSPRHLKKNEMGVTDKGGGSRGPFSTGS